MLFVKCIKEECKINGGQYEFEIPASLSPLKDTFNVGDTIFFVSGFSENVFERETGRTYMLKDFKFYPRLRLREVSGVMANEGALLNFDVLVDTSTNFSQFNYSDGAIGYVGEYSYANSGYSLVYQLVPKEPGLYYFSYFSNVFNFGEGQDFEGKCSNLDIDAAVVLNDGADNNIHMLSDSPDPHYNNWILQKPEERFYKFGGYCFYVKE